jgi:2-C-methyl-D-erythritol 2,4-cyclodiphosphate synthase
MHRVGIGYDVHPLVEGRDLVLGGVKIPFEKGLSGHSDADIVCHAIIDAILGAIGRGDIGKHFPDNDPAYKDASGLLLLEKVTGILSENNGRVSNIDLTIIAEKPKLASYTEKMRENLARALEIRTSMVSVKCCTNNGLGFVGEGKGMACLATVLVEVKG